MPAGVRCLGSFTFFMDVDLGEILRLYIISLKFDDMGTVLFFTMFQSQIHYCSHQNCPVSSCLLFMTEFCCKWRATLSEKPKNRKLLRGMVELQKKYTHE